MSLDRAAGGEGYRDLSNDGNGGMGAAGTIFDGEDGHDCIGGAKANAGGGGGGGGRIRINVRESALIQPGAIITPSANPADCLGLCTPGGLGYR